MSSPSTTHRGRSIGRIALAGAACVCTMPGLTQTPRDPGPPPAAAAAVPTLAEAKSFIEEKIVAASLLKCPYDPEKTIEGSTRIAIDGGKLLMTSGSSEVHKGRDGSISMTHETASVTSLAVVDVEPKIIRSNDGCQGASLYFECDKAAGNCVVSKTDFTHKYYDSDGTVDTHPNTMSGTYPSGYTRIGDLALAVRIINAFRFYKSEIAKLTPRSAF
jgi:hypothetical protein